MLSLLKNLTITHWITANLDMLIQAAIVFISGMIAWYILSKVVRSKLGRLAKIKSKNRKQFFWLRTILESTNRPANFFIPSQTLLVMANILNSSSTIDLILGRLQWLNFAITFTVICLRIIKKLEHYLLYLKNDDTVDKFTVDIMTKLLSVSTVIISTLFVMQIMGVSLQALLAFGGLSGVVIGMATKDFFAGTLSTISIYMDKPFVVGDVIRIGIDKPIPIEGAVEKIDWRFTKLRGNDKKLINVPNIQITTMLLENITLSSYRRMVLHLELAGNLSTNSTIIREELRRNLAKLKLLANDQKMTIDVLSANEFSLLLKIALYFNANITSPVVHNIKHEVVTILWRIFNPRNIRFDAKFEA